MSIPSIKQIGKTILGVGIVLVIVLGFQRIYALTAGPTAIAPNGNKTPFLNVGPEPQEVNSNFYVGPFNFGVYANANINTGNSGAPRFGVSGGVANLVNGFYAKKTTGNAGLINTDMYVGFANVGANGTPSTLRVDGMVDVSGDVTDGSLAHNGNTLEAVCVDPQGILKPCTPGIQIGNGVGVPNNPCPIIETLQGCYVHNAPNMGQGQDSISCDHTIHDQLGTEVTTYDLQYNNNGQWLSAGQTQLNAGTNPPMPLYVSGLGNQFDQYTFRARGYSNACGYGPFVTFNQPVNNGGL